MRTILAACTLAIFSLSAVMAEDFFARITKIETKDGKTTISGNKGKKDDKKDFTLTVDAKVKIAKGKFNMEDKKFEAGDDIKDGFKNDVFKEVADDKPLNVYLTTDKKDVVTQILVTGGKKKKDDK